MPHVKFMHGSAEETETAFYDAMSRADIEAMMALWADDDDIVCIHPNGPRLHGHAAIRAAFDMLFERGGVHIRVRQLHISQNMSTSIHNLVEELHQAGDNDRNMHILATNVYMKTPRGWRIVLHHASVAPGAAPEEAVTTAMLH
ncbi:YybH family protein [Collimonas sp.]|uniref:YybH family protein n=1 Tax=Collimonas sp. TaxID=1963772 RepID=UPI0037BE97ED